MIEAARLNAESVNFCDEALIQVKELVKGSERGPVGIALGHDAGKVPRPFERIQKFIHHGWGQWVVVFQESVHLVSHRTHELDMSAHEFFVLEPVASSQNTWQHKAQQKAGSNQGVAGRGLGLTIRKPAA